MASQSFQFLYDYGGNGSFTGTADLLNGRPVDWELIESDAPIDGQTAFDTSIALSINGTSPITVTLRGVTSEGEPIIQDGSSFYVLSNTPGLTSREVSQGTYTYCFAPGTLIATPAGENTVETLRIGDLIATADGRAVPVKWIGHQTVTKLFAGERARPVRVSAGALGDGLPHTDLVLTADHALILDGLAINAGALVNGTTVTLEPLAAVPDRVTYYHVETEDHDAILANGAAAETFVDYVTREAFDNYAEYVDLYGAERIITEMPLPRISTARLVPHALRKRIAGEAAA